MKVKEVEVTANVAWSPADVDNDGGGVFLAAGTAAQQLDATFSTNAALEIYALDLTESGHQMPKAASMPVDHRYHKLIWGAGGRPRGVLAGGLDQGVLKLYDADSLLRGATESCVLATSEKHTGPVQALDFNPFQSNLLASGASESEVFIWDVNKPSSPMTPGAKSQPADDVRSVAWNRQVQHILASAFASRCVVWDLRKNDPIIKVSGDSSTSRMRNRVVAWHPEVATQLCLASEDDHAPVIQVWDLRLASSPIRTLESHRRGVLAVAWCQQDPDLLLSCGKDNRILCWNPNSTEAPNGEVLCELATSGQWSFDVSWCPRNPAIIAGASFDGRVSLYSLLGGPQQVDTSAVSSNIADSFPGMDSMQPVSVSASQAISQAQQASAAAASQQLKKPPKWLRRRCGATFGFGGKLVTFGMELPAVNQQQQQQQQQPSSTATRSQVTLHRVVTEPELVERSRKLETSIQSQNLPDFCQSKIDGLSKEDERGVWRFVRANFAENPRLEFLDLLGYDMTSVADKIDAESGVRAPEESEERSSSAYGLETLASALDTTVDKEGAFEEIANKHQQIAEEEKSMSKPFRLDTSAGPTGQLTRALLSGNVPLAVELCVKARRWADALALATVRGGEKLARDTLRRYLADAAADGADEANLIRALTLTSPSAAGGSDRADGGWRDFARRCAGDDWRQALAAVATYAEAEEFAEICAELGDRRLADGDGQAALICYICAGDLEKLVAAWIDTKDVNSGPAALQDMVELVMCLRSGVEAFTGEANLPQSGPLAGHLSRYAGMLAAQGALTAALTYLGNANTATDGGQSELALLRERLSGATGVPAAAAAAAGGRRQHRSSTSHGRTSVGGRLSALRRESRQSRSASQCSEEDSVFASSFKSSGGRDVLAHQGQGQQRRPSVPQQYAPPPMSSQQAAPGPFVPPVHATPQQMYNPMSYDYSAISTSPEANPGFGMAVPSGTQPNIMVPSAAPVSARPPSTTPSVPGHNEDVPVSNGPGWNDPPPMPSTVVKSRLSHSTKTVYSPSSSLQQSPATEPIIQPLLGGPAQMAPPMMGGDSYGMMTPSYGNQSAGFQPQPMMDAYAASPPPQQPPQMNMMQPAAPAQFMTPTPPVGGPAAAANAADANNPAPPANFGRMAKPEPVPKGPIPAEHQVLQDVFDGLKDKCLAAANHPQVRRKLEDVGRKLEILYDKLREGSLSAATTSSLHELSALLRGSDYPSAASLYAAVVSGASFAEAAPFMPAIKVLMQQGQQLRVVF